MKTVEIPPDYFYKMATRDYYDWRPALIREFIQNSVDAGASEIHFQCDNKSLTVRDNGWGMNKQTIETALLTLGGSQKQENSTGGFGKAKELLYFSWPSWEIQSQDVTVKGSGSKYGIFKSDWINGTVSKIETGDKFAGTRRYIAEYLKLSSLNGQYEITFYFNGEMIAVSGCIHGEKIFTIDGLGDLHKVESDSDNKVIVQAHGLFMFNCYSAIDKTYVFNITQPSYTCLTSNRDGFTGEWQDKFTKMIGKVAIDTESTNIRKETVIQVQSLTRKDMPAEAIKDTIDSDGLKMLTDLATAAGKAVGDMSLEDVRQLVSGNFLMTQNIMDKTTRRQIKTAVVNRIKISKAFDQCLSWYRSEFPEGFLIVTNQEITSDFVYDLYHKDTLKMAHLWKAIVDHVADKAEIQKNYGYGMVFDGELEKLAECRDSFIMFNPIQYYEMDWDDVPLDMLLSAAEELTHHIGYSYHNESFKCRYTEIVRKALSGRTVTNDLMNVMRKVRKNC